MGRHLQQWRGEPGSPGLISRALMATLALFPPLVFLNWLMILLSGDPAGFAGATILLMAGLLVAASYPYWLPTIWRANNRHRIAAVRARHHVAPAREHLGLHASAEDLPKRW